MKKFLIFFVLFVVFSFHGLNASAATCGVPYSPCGVAAAYYVFCENGVNKTATQIESELSMTSIPFSEQKYIAPEILTNYLNSQGFSAQLKSNSTLSNLKSAIDSGEIVIVMGSVPYTFGIELNVPHYWIVTGYSDSLQQTIAWNANNYSYSEFDRRWGALWYNHLMIVVEKMGSQPQICSSFTYSDWGNCLNGIQTRTILTRSPTNCIGGNSITTQTCTIPVFCGDNVCSVNENCNNCATDCGNCSIIQPSCGNNIVESGENCLNCPNDVKCDNWKTCNQSTSQCEVPVPVCPAYCPPHFSCQNSQCVRFECDANSAISPWSAITCENGMELQQRTFRDYTQFPLCEPFNIVQYQSVVPSPKNYCEQCTEPIETSYKTGIDCQNGNAVFRQQGKGCAIVNGEKVSTDIEFLSYEPNLFCSIPIIGVFFVNPVLLIVLLLFVVFGVLFLTRKNKKK